MPAARLLPAAVPFTFLIVTAALAGCTAAESADSMGLAHAAVHEMELRIHECGDVAGCEGVEGTSALAIVAWATENEDRVNAYPTENGLMIDFEDGSVLVTEHFQSGRLRAWTVR